MIPNVSPGSHIGTKTPAPEPRRTGKVDARREPALGAEKVLPTRLSRILIFILFNNLGNLLLVQSEPKWLEHGR